MFTLIIKTDNAAFHGDDDEDAARRECARILRETAKKLEEGRNASPLFDGNGNKVGSYDLTL